LPRAARCCESGECRCGRAGFGFQYLERAAELQDKAMSCNSLLRLVPDDIAKKTVTQFGREREHWARLHLDALRRKLDHEHPEYAS